MAETVRDALEAVAPLRREYVAEALDGMIWQAQGAIRFLERGEDAPAKAAMARAFDFARMAARTMNSGEISNPDRQGASACANG